jgi:hypothetical protein
MRNIKSLLFIVLVLTMVFCSGQAAADALGSASGDTPCLQIVGNAAGTKYEGPLTLYYAGEGVSTDMHVFLRLRKGSELYPFSTIISGIDPTDLCDQVSKLKVFFSEQVLPVLYRGVTLPTVVLVKSVDQTSFSNESSSEGAGCCSGMNFVIMDVVLAVQD